jgi:hypothetical protein
MIITRTKLRALIREAIGVQSSESGKAKMPTGDEYLWVPAKDVGGRESLAYLAIDDVMKQVKTILGKKTSPKWRLSDIHDYLYGGLSPHRYSNAQPGFDKHPVLGLYMLPPSWTIALKNGLKRATHYNNKLRQATSADEKKKIAVGAGYLSDDAVERMQAHIDKFMKVDPSYV